ncbi:MAG: hypothetical protein ACJ0TD_00995 [Arenicellales bacterium]
MKTDWKTRLTSRRTLGRLIRFELLVAMIFVIAGVAMQFVPEPEAASGRAVAAGAVALADKSDRFVYPFPVIEPMSTSRTNLYEFGTVRRDDAALLELEPEIPEEEEPLEEVVETEPEPPPPPLPDLDGLELIGTLAGSGGQSIAVVRDDNIGVTVYVKTGDDLNGSVVAEISPTSVRVRLGEEEDELRASSFLMDY